MANVAISLPNFCNIYEHGKVLPLGLSYEAIRCGTRHAIHWGQIKNFFKSQNDDFSCGAIKTIPILRSAVQIFGEQLQKVDASLTVCLSALSSSHNDGTFSCREHTRTL